MADRYLLPCPCGRKTAVEPRLAGQIIACPCGAPLEVPTLLAMTRLEREENPRGEGVAQEAWGNSQRVGLVGWIVLVLALGGTFKVIIDRPKPPSDRINVQRWMAAVETGLADATPSQTLEAWWYISRKGLSDIPVEAERDYTDALIRYRFALGFTLLAALAGFGLIAGAHVAGKKARERRAADAIFR